LDWREVASEDEMRAFLSPFASQRLLSGDRAIERVRVADARCYKDCTFIEAQLRLPSGIRGILFGLLLPTKQVALFDGEARVIHSLNSAGFLTGMDEAETVLEYLMFFCGAVWAEDGPFTIVRKLDDAPEWSNAPADVVARIAETLIEHPEVIQDVDESWRARATVFHRDALFNVVFHVQRDGVVEMLADSSAVTGVPRFSFTMADRMRVRRQNET
jgi:hypothetical protein